MKTNRFSQSFSDADRAFNSMYSTELKQLKGLSQEEINTIIPASNNMETYRALVTIVEKASRDNLAQAQLLSKIKNLGASAVKLAEKIPSWSSML